MKIPVQFEWVTVTEGHEVALVNTKVFLYVYVQHGDTQQLLTSTPVAVIATRYEHEVPYYIVTDILSHYRWNEHVRYKTLDKAKKSIIKRLRAPRSAR